jgi:putative aminopeptidase FrvX
MRDELLRTLSNCNGAAGDEGAVRDLLRSRIEKHVDETGTNPMGNLHATAGGGSKGRVLLTAHMDEIALIVTGVDGNGLISFQPVGGVVPALMVGNDVIIGREKRIPGVIAYKSYHLMTSEERKRTPPLKNLSIDIGASTREEAGEVTPGDYVYFTSEYTRQGSCRFGKAFDDRAGCAAVVEILRGGARSEAGVTAVFTTQEEVGLRGASTAAFGLEGVRFNLNMEATVCSDREVKDTYSPVTVLGGGPAITVMDRTTVTHRGLLDFVRKVAESHGIPHQLKRAGVGGTDAGVIHLTGTGIPAVTVALPVRYIHSPWGIFLDRDFDNFLELGRAVVREAHTFVAGG